jgi:hypothetical protein
VRDAVGVHPDLARQPEREPKRPAFGARGDEAGGLHLGLAENDDDLVPVVVLTRVVVVIVRVVGSAPVAVGVVIVVIIVSFRLGTVLRAITLGVRVVMVVSRAASQDYEDGAGKRQRQ